MARPRIIADKVHREHLFAMLHFAHFMLLLIRSSVPHSNLSRSLENASVCSFRSIIIRHLLCRVCHVHTFHTMWLVYRNVYYVNWMWVMWMRWCERTSARAKDKMSASWNRYGGRERVNVCVCYAICAAAQAEYEIRKTKLMMYGWKVLNAPHAACLQTSDDVIVPAPNFEICFPYFIVQYNGLLPYDTCSGSRNMNSDLDT